MFKQVEGGGLVTARFFAAFFFFFPMEEVHILAYCFSLLGQLDACDGNAKRCGGRVGGESKLRCSEKR